MHVAYHQVVLDSNVLGFIIRFAVVADLEEGLASSALPVQQDVAPNRNSLATYKSVDITIAVLNHDVGLGVSGDAPPTAGEIIEEDVVLNDHISHTVHVDVLIGPLLIVEDIVLHGDKTCAVQDLQQVVVIRIVKDVVAESNVFRPQAAI